MLVFTGEGEARLGGDADALPADDGCRKEWPVPALQRSEGKNRRPGCVSSCRGSVGQGTLGGGKSGAVCSDPGRGATRDAGEEAGRGAKTNVRLALLC